MGMRVEIKNLSYSYNDNDNQIKDINIKIAPGEVVVLMGKSGCGKSSVIRTINGLIPFFYEGKLQGNIVINGEPTDKVEFWQRSKLIGNVFQDPRSQFFANEVAGEIAFGCENYGFNRLEIINRVEGSAKEMGINDLLDKSIHSLSYGMRQKVAIASAYATNPEIYIMDEPSANLDIHSIDMLARMIMKLKKLGKTIIIAEHRLYYLSGIADRYVFIDDGEIVKSFNYYELSHLKQEDLIKMGLRVPNLKCLSIKQEKTKNDSEVLMQIDDISKKINGLNILEDINFKCCRGEIVGLIGPNGAGKSTLGKVLAGLLKENSGGIKIAGKTAKKNQRIGKVWYIPQDLDSQLFGEDLLDELLTGLKKTEVLQDRALKILRELDLKSYIDRHPSTLSGGQKQRLALGVALIYDAPIIILDEPTSGLDGLNMRRVSKMIKEISLKGKTIIIITHDAEFALNTCKRVIRIEKGKITDDFSPLSADYLLEKMGYKDEGLEKVTV